MYRFLRLVLILGVIGFGVFWLLTEPNRLDPADIAGLEPDLARGEAVFWAGGCASCHAAPNAGEEARLVLSGGQGFASDFGTFYAPNISSDPTQGIGAWSTADLITALRHGTSPEGKHYYPAFPYSAYAKAELSDLVSLAGFLKTLPASNVANRAHDVGFPFSWRRLLGGWKLLFLDDDWVVDGDLSPEAVRGRYLSEALAHCGECHTPRNVLGGLQTDKWLAGAPVPGSTRGRFPNITPHRLTWSEADIASYLKSGFTPDFDTAGGHMAEVVENFARLSNADRAAVAAYLKAVPAVAGK